LCGSDRTANSVYSSKPDLAQLFIAIFTIAIYACSLSRRAALDARLRRDKLRGRDDREMAVSHTPLMGQFDSTKEAVWTVRNSTMYRKINDLLE
jgi:hypothetical protein